MKEIENAWKYITDEQYEIAKKNGIKRGTVHNRVAVLNWTVEDAISKTPIKGMAFTDAELKLMKKHKLSYFAVYRRLKAGWSREAAFRPKKTGNWLSDELIEKAKENGISYELLYWRKKQCWSDEEASTRKPSQSNKQIRKKEGLR